MGRNWETVQPEMAGGLKFWVKEVEKLHYLLSETKVLNSEGATVELICVCILQTMYTDFLPFLLIIFNENLAYP